MLTVFGVGEVAISVASTPSGSGPIEHSIRDVGAVTHALCTAGVGAVVGVRGPYGTGWGIDDLPDGPDVVVVAGGIGLAPFAGPSGVGGAAAGRDGAGSSSWPGRAPPTRSSTPDDLDAWRGAGATWR